MRYAIFCQNYIQPRWNCFSREQRTPSRFARILKALGAPGRYDRQSEEIARLGRIDPAQDDIDAWIKKWKLPTDAFKGRPKHVDLPTTKQRVSEVYDSKDECNAVFDLKFANRDARNDPDWGSVWVWGVHDSGCSWTNPVAYTFNEFTVEEVP